MQILSRFDDPTSWHEIAHGVLFYAPIAGGMHLGMKIEHRMDHGRVFYPCLKFDEALRLVDTTPYQNIPLFALGNAGLHLAEVAAPRSQPMLGDINLIDGDVLLNVLNQKDTPTAVDLGSGKVTPEHWPTQIESKVSCPDWTIILPSILTSDSYDADPIFAWPMPQRP